MGAGASFISKDTPKIKENQSTNLSQGNNQQERDKNGKEIPNATAGGKLGSKINKSRDNEVSVRGAENKGTIRIKPGAGIEKSIRTGGGGGSSGVGVVAGGSGAAATATAAAAAVEAQKKKVSLQELFTPAGVSPRPISRPITIFDPNSTHLTVGDIVRVDISPTETIEGMVLECLENDCLTIDLGETTQTFPISQCHLLLRNDEYEIGDRVEVQPMGSSLYFVGKVISIDSSAKTMAVLMDGDDPDDIEKNIPFEQARKLMSRRAFVVNRWKKAFMMVVASNFFSRIHFDNSLSVKS